MQLLSLCSTELQLLPRKGLVSHCELIMCLGWGLIPAVWHNELSLSGPCDWLL
jgi:hypothetical protein